MSQTETATLAGGCFWCLEAVFDEVRGVESVESGYMGGALDNPSYDEVGGGETGHAEVVQVRFDPAVIGFAELLSIFFTVHDPTTLNRQGNDVGTQYRSAVFFHTPEQERIARKQSAHVTAQLGERVVTEIAPASRFWVAEPYHQEYFARNPRAGYCQLVVAPKVAKFRQYFGDKRKG
ncbi:MAG: peptide-methionine (S)-S-oxide reductase MsrA [Acidobacteria bacterium]|nr:peptide-methionine (S)-S-oxide reductase MsrA [Acidobacteriota bacterium]